MCDSKVVPVIDLAKCIVLSDDDGFVIYVCDDGIVTTKDIDRNDLHSIIEKEMNKRYDAKRKAIQELDIFKKCYETLSND